MSKPKEYAITSGATEPKWMLDALISQRYLQPVTLEKRLYTPKDHREEVAGISKFNPNIESPQFDRNRVHFREAIKAAMKHTFAEFALPTENGLDIGSGATGTNVHTFLDGIINRNSWTQTDVNPGSVEANRALHPDSRIYTASYHDLGALGLSDNIDIVTGLSTLDATQFIPHAIGEIRQALRTGGYLLHVQDVRPGNGAGIRELQARGQDFPYQVLNVQSSNVSYDYMAFATPEGVLTSGELFRRQMDRALKEDGGFDVLANDWVRSGKSIPGKVSHTYYQNIRLQYMTNTPPAVHEAYVIVTVARKK